jgi:hypothetical protein
MTASLVASGAGLAGLALLALLVAGCGDDDDATADVTSTDSAGGIESSAAVPADVDVRLARRITDPLPDEVVVRFQRINRGPDPRINLWWELTAGGDVYLAAHSSDTSDPDTPFDTPRPDEPTVSLGPDSVADVTAALDAASFAEQPGYQWDPGVEDGTFSVVTARLPDGIVHEVVYEGVDRPPVDTMELLTERIVEGS